MNNGWGASTDAAEKFGHGERNGRARRLHNGVHAVTPKPFTTWARAGFVVAAPTYPHTAAGVADFNPVDLIYQPADAEYVITQVVRRLGPVGPIAAAGHSGGGVATLGMFTGDRDRRLATLESRL